MNDNEIHSEGTAPKNPRKKKKFGWLVVVAVLLLMAGVVAAMMRKPAEPVVLPTNPPTTQAPTVATDAPTEEPTEPQMLANMAELYAQNPDIVGWIRIEGTKLDYPVMHTPDDEEKYLYTGFDGNRDVSGLPFIDKDCKMDPESQNLILYGHNMKNGTGFKTLFSYLQKDFREEHNTIYFSTLYEERTYEVLSVFYDRVYKQEDDCFKFYQFIDPTTEEEFDAAIDYFQKNAIYDTDVDAEYGDSLITLVTCSYHVRRGRLVLVAREIVDPAEVTAEIVNP